MLSRLSFNAARARVQKAAQGAAVVTEHVAKRPLSAFAKIALGAATASAFSAGVALASGDVANPPEYPWPHRGLLDSFDAATLRRGYEVYRQVCATCHSMKFISFRNLVGTTHTEEQAKHLAESFTVRDGPDDKGEMFDRKGRLSDHLPNPYPNDEFARAANNGALPPDLSLMAKARPRGEDYIFALLTGYHEPPAGIQLREGLYYNPYFQGGAIGMSKQLNDGGIEYEDGTPATESQMAKDVSCFLTWAAEPFQDERKKTSIKWLSSLFVMLVLTAYHKRMKWNIYKTRKIEYRS